MVSRVNFSKTTKLDKPVGGVQFVVFKKFSSAYYTKLLAITTALNKYSDHQINWEQTDFGTKRPDCVTSKISQEHFLQYFRGNVLREFRSFTANFLFSDIQEHDK